MPRLPFDLVVFDLDGTLADTAPDIAGALNHVLRHAGRAEIEPEKIRRMIGDGARALIRRALVATGGAPEALIDRAFALYVDRYAANICIGTKPYPRVEGVLNELERAGVRTAICTNKPERLTRLLLEALGWRNRFAAVIAGDSLPVRKPDPAPLLAALEQARGRRAAFVGDSIVDAETARAAGLPFVAVSFGFSDRPAQEFGADAVIDGFGDLLPTLARL